MKQTNNAIKFLLAQYRAIFKHAYLKGLASTVVLTAALAAGAANAGSTGTVLEDNDEWSAALTAVEGTITIGTDKASGDTGIFQNITILNPTSNLVLNKGQKLVIDAQGTAEYTSNFIKASGSGTSATLSGSGTLTIRGNGTTDSNLEGLHLSAQNSGTLAVNLGEIETDGFLAITISGGTAKAIVTAKKIVIGNDEFDSSKNGINDGRANVWIGDTSAKIADNSGSIEFGAEDTVVTINRDGKLRLTGTSGTTALKAGTINVEQGILNFRNAASSSDSVKVSSHDINVNSGFFVLYSGSNVTLDLADKDNVSGSLDFSGSDTAKSYFVVGGNLILDKAQVNLDNNTVLAADTDCKGVTDYIQIGSGASSNASLSLSSGILSAYLTGKNADGTTLTYVNENKQFKTPDDSEDDASQGSIVLASGGKLVFNDENEVDLSKFHFSGGTTFLDGGITVNATGTIAGEKLTVSGKLTTNGSDTVDLSSTNSLNIEATNLTLGDSSKKFADTSFGFASATAKNVTFKNSGDALTFNDDLILSSTKTVDGVEVSDNGVIKGPVILSGSMTVNGGKYTNEGTFTLNGGTLEVVNGDTSAFYDESSLKLNKFTIDTSNSVTITVDGKLAGEYDASSDQGLNKLTQLDLFDGFELKGTANNASLSVTSGGIVLLKASSVQDSIDTAETGTSSGTLSLSATSGGKLVVDGNLTLDFTSANANVLNSALKIGSGGILEAGDVTVTSTMDSGAESESTAYGLANGGSMRFNSLTLNNNSQLKDATEADDVYLTGGKFEIASALNSNDTINLKNDAQETKTIDLTLATTNASGTGTIGTKKLVVDSANATINVVQGKWTGSSTAIDLKSGALNIGDTSGSIASLTADSLNSASTVKVNKDSSATFNAFTQTAGTITVNGVLTVNGKHSGSGADESWGVNTADSTGTIEVTGNAAKLSFGKDAVGNISVIDNKITYANDNDTFASNIKLSSFATLELGLSEDINFTEEGLKNLRQEFISGNKGEVLTNGYIDIGDAKIAGVEVSGGKVSWTDLEKISDIIADIKSTEQSTATLTDVSSNDTVNANVGNILADDGVTSVTVGQATLNQANSSGAFITNNAGDILGATVAQDGTLGLYNGGQIGAVSLTAGTDSDNLTTLNVVADNGAETAIKSISAGNNTQVNINGVTKVTEDVNVNNLKVDQALTVAKDVTVSGKLASTEGVNTGSISAQKLNVTGETEYAGNLQISGDASFGGITYLGGNNSFGGNVTFTTGAQLDRGTTTADSIALGEDASLEIVGNASVSTNVIESTSNYAIKLVIGEEAGTEAGESWDSSAGYLTAGRIDLNGGTLIIDPEYGKSASIVAVGSFGDADDADAAAGHEAGKLDGRIIALRNSIVAIGVKDGTDNKALDQVKSTFSRYFDANGSLNEDNVGAIAYVAKALDVDASAGSTSKIVIDSTKSFSTYEKDIASGAYADKVDNNNIYLGNNSVLAISDYAALESKDSNGQRAAINFTGGDASLYAEADAKIVLVGDGFSSRDEVLLFSDEGTNEGVLINGNSVTVETINGLLNFTLEKDKETTGGTLSLNHEAVASSFSQASAPVKYSLIAYAANDNNWAQEGQDGYKTDVLHGDVVAGVYSDNGTDFYTKSGADKKPLTEAQSDDYVAIKNDDGTFTVYTDGYNSFLDNVVRNSTTGIEAEQAARLAVFGGAAQAALSAGATTYDAISGRMGVGAQTGSITFADNGQGAGLWVTPVYKNHDSDGFGAQGASYGVDMDMYGVALGGDFTLANGLRVGAAFNVGSGDADGQGTGAGVSNDFDYYGFAVYGGFTYDKLSIVGDISYTVVDNDVEANTAVEKLTASMDSANLSVGVTGQYSFDYNGLSIVPHAGLRYTNIDLDDYTVKGSEDVAHFDGDSVNIFSIPVGVTFSKDYTAGDWTIKPAFDLTLTANMGDDSIEGTVAWANISNMSTKVESEVLDDWTYGATLGVSAQSGNFSLGFGVNYTGASSADEYSVGANARFVF